MALTPAAPFAIIATISFMAVAAALLPSRAFIGLYIAMHAKVTVAKT